MIFDCKKHVTSDNITRGQRFNLTPCYTKNTSVFQASIFYNRTIILKCYKCQKVLIKLVTRKFLICSNFIVFSNVHF